MNDLKVIYECPSKLDYISIKKYIKQNISVWFIEPFHTYHHTKSIPFYPTHLPVFALKLIDRGKVSVLNANEINAKEIYTLAADKAVKGVEYIYPCYRKKYKKLLNYVSSTLNSPTAEYVFKKNLCNKLAQFYSVNILLHRIEKHFHSKSIIVYPDTNVYSYRFVQNLLVESNQEFYGNYRIRFPFHSYVNSFLNNFKQNIISKTKLCAQTIASGFFYKFHSINSNKKKKYSYGVAIIGPRQLRDNNRGPDLIIDNKKIQSNEVVYFPLISLNSVQKKTLAKLPGEIHQLPKPGYFFSHFLKWRRLLYLSVKHNFLRNTDELKAASNLFFNYFKWKRILESIDIKHFITHADFGSGHIGRNLAFNQNGVQTWYFTDSMNLGCNFKKKGADMCHPFWTYLNYDHLVTWDEALARYYAKHPGSIKRIHVVGCLWGEHIQKKNSARKRISVPGLNYSDNHYVISCFDTTYSRNGLTSYEEGLDFAGNLLRLAEECRDIHIIFKEKKDRSIHHILDPLLGPTLLEIYQKMDNHPRITLYSNQVDASILISLSDAVVSFPFTSTTYEALSFNKPAIWHDSLKYYRNTVYGKVGGVVTHGYEELKAKVQEIKNMKTSDYQNPISIKSPFMDPYRDGKAVDRFRNLLTNNDIERDTGVTKDSTDSHT